MASVIMCFNVLALSACPAGIQIALLCSQEVKKKEKKKKKTGRKMRGKIKFY